MEDTHIEIICIIDRSGSMGAIRSDAIGGFNTFLEEQKKEAGTARLSLVLFDHEYEVRYHAVPLQDVVPLDNKTYVPRGTTALLDAVGRTIDDVGKRLSQTEESERPDQVIVAILTDGLENASTDYTWDRVSKMIEHQRQKYSWEFIFLAANQDAIATAGRMAILKEDAMEFEATDTGIHQAFAQMTHAVSKKRSGK